MDARQTDVDYLRTLEEVKRQYQQYLEVSKLYDLPTERKDRPAEHNAPSPERPLTTNWIQMS